MTSITMLEGEDGRTTIVVLDGEERQDRHGHVRERRR
jgi:hypothetical protein